MKILITGGLGYIGGRLTEFFLNEKGYDVTVTTVLDTEEIPESIRAAQILHADVLDRDQLTAACEGIDYIIHLAATNEIVSGQKPHEALRVNVDGTLNLLEVAKTLGIKKFMYFSTFHIYGPNTGAIITEEAIPNPIHHYSTTHYMAELYINQFRQTEQFETIIIRLSNSFGAPLVPGVDRWTLVVNDLCYQAIKNGELRLASSGEQHRDFIPLCDVLSAVDLLISTPYEQLGNGIFNVGSGFSMSIRNMCEQIREVYFQNYGVELPLLIPDDAPKQDPSPVQYDISKLQNLGFSPSGEFRSEILKTLKICERKVKEEE